MSVDGRDGIETTRIAGMAAQNALDGEPEPFDGAMHLDGFYGVGRTGGVEAAAGRIKRRDAALIKPDGQDEELLGERHAMPPSSG